MRVLWRDISTPIRDDMPVYPGDPTVRITRALAMARGDAADVTRIDMPAHAGTHVDAPAHVIPGATGVEGLDVDALIGGCHVGAVAVDAGADGIGPEHLRALALPPDCRRVLLGVRGPGVADPPHDAPGVTADGARWLVDAGVVLVGVDTMSVAPPDDALPTHRILLRAGVVILEGLDLRGVSDGEYTLVCLPLLVPGADGAPARAVLGPPPGP